MGQVIIILVHYYSHIFAARWEDEVRRKSKEDREEERREEKKEEERREERDRVKNKRKNIKMVRKAFRG